MTAPQNTPGSVTAAMLLSAATCLYCLCFSDVPEPATHLLTHHPRGEVLTVCGPCAEDPWVHNALEEIALAAAAPFRLTG